MGKILSLLMRFAMPVQLALFLQAMYGAVDLLVVGRFAQAVDVSAVSTGSQIMMALTGLVSSFATGTTISSGKRSARKDPRKQVKSSAAGWCFF